MAGTFESRILDYPMVRLERTRANLIAAIGEAIVETMDTKAEAFFRARLLIVNGELSRRVNGL